MPSSSVLSSKPVVPGPLARLRLAKSLSDRGLYEEKALVLRMLMRERPAEFVEDSREGAIVGITHVPTGFRIHLPAGQLPLPLSKSAGAREAVKTSSWAASASADVANTLAALAKFFKVQKAVPVLESAGKISGPVGAGYLGVDIAESLGSRPEGQIRPLAPLANLAEWGAKAQAETKLDPGASAGEALKAQWRGFRWGAIRPHVAMGTALDVGAQATAESLEATQKAGAVAALTFLMSGRMGGKP